MKQDDFNRLVDLLAADSITAPANVGVSGYFHNLILNAELPPAFKQQRSQWTGAAQFDAVELVRWAQNKGTNPANPRFAVLGSILMPLLGGLGVEQAALLATLAVRYSWIRDADSTNRLISRYQIPQATLPAPAAIAYGPDIDVHGADEVQLQGFLRPEPDFLDVGFLLRGSQSARSVCRIEVGLTGVTGTGVLIDHGFVLTNFHVLGNDADQVTRAAPTTRLRFGAFTGKGGVEETGQVAGLDAGQPIAASSPIATHDFLLLRTDAGANNLADVQPVRFSVRDPVARSGINILQHPNGSAMKLAVSANGVTSAAKDTGLLQYVSRTAPGSSGGPCFDDEWNMVALHHAVRSRVFGVIGEGILVSAIYHAIRGLVAARPD